MILRYWRMSKAEMVLASTGKVFMENVFWTFYNVQANVKNTEPCFEDLSVRVSIAKQLFNALSDSEVSSFQCH